MWLADWSCPFSYYLFKISEISISLFFLLILTVNTFLWGWQKRQFAMLHTNTLTSQSILYNENLFQILANPPPSLRKLGPHSHPQLQLLQSAWTVPYIAASLPTHQPHPQRPKTIPHPLPPLILPSQKIPAQRHRLPRRVAVSVSWRSASALQHRAPTRHL